MNRKPGRPRKEPRIDEESASLIDPLQEFPDDQENHTPQLPNAMDSAPPAWVDKLHIDSRVTTLQLVAMFRHCGLEERRIGQICGKAGLWAERGKGFQLIPAVGALIAHYKRVSERGKADEGTERERKRRIDNDTSELKFRELAGELCPMEAAKQFWSDARIELRKVVETATYLTEDQKKKLLAGFQGLRAKLELGQKGEEK